jgi:nucleotidyltransferase/DNA polymerase involved in DNA repair
VLGLETMGQLAALDHSAVVARFGSVGAEMHDLVRGMDRRPLRPRRPLERLSADVELEPPAQELEPLRFVLHHLSGTLCEQLAARGAGAARAALTLSLERSERDQGSRTMTYEQALPEPSAAAELLERLLLARLEADPPSAPVERLALQLDGTAPEAGQQLTLFDRQGAHAARLEWQLASLAIRFGEDRILRATTADTDDPLAERRFAWHDAVGSEA